MTAALDAVARLDAGTTLPGDTVLADRLDVHCQRQAFVWPCLICGRPGGPECTSCTAAWDKHLERLGDL